ncbi:Holliday junction branch migration protein RuvA [Oceanicoccus sagamiensis]|uniref:Holliday junction branch migration complex subunit RuvA n=1 Tax=Oceanicoccus sagamiensis TaxID=716816 RepID=A0A1X9NF64_9GAMM|nr:Holliday junction branch migration protein RuvA [Oceanicoccus sagamiensis]ARN75082.1 Holliday junction branch migration protein RuvA [Oceanicoccus sagamiensis]
MIGRLHGVILEKQAPEILIDVNGIGYEVQVPMTTIYQLPEVGKPVTLHTHFVVREDAQLLYGFAERRERSLFRTLIKVNGVGPKLALTILSGIESDDFVRCVRDGDTQALVRLPGVGKKTAERLLVEMKDRLKDWSIDGTAASASDTGAASNNDILAEAESALVALGYKPQEASKAIAAVNDASMDSSEALIRMALKNMVS